MLLNFFLFRLALRIFRKLPLAILLPMIAVPLLIGFIVVATEVRAARGRMNQRSVIIHTGPPAQHPHKSH